jgi:hypothetical protein
MFTLIKPQHSTKSVCSYSRSSTLERIQGNASNSSDTETKNQIILLLIDVHVDSV